MKRKSLADALRYSARKWPDKGAVLTPDPKAPETANSPKGFRPVIYREFEEKVRGYAAALKDWGLKRGERLALQSENCFEWALVDWACQSLGIVLVPIYPTLPADQTQYIVKDAQCAAIVSSSPEQQAKVADLDLPKKLLSELSSTTPMDAADWDAEVDMANPEDVATFIYTSGTTGNPKGAMLPHRAILHVLEFVEVNLPITHDDIFLSFLPMSHVFERVAGQALPVYLGGTIGYSKSLATLANDLMAVRPTILLCVPRFLEATMDRILDNVKKQPPIQQKLFNWALDQGTKKVEGKFAPFAGILDAIVGKKVRARTGGRIRLFVSGGAALPPKVAQFYMAFGFTVLQGWGLTETSAGTTLNHPDRNKYWTVGESLGMEIKIADDGEILVRGPGLMLGYWNLPEETALAIDDKGWFHTGDIGEFEGKSLKITDRKKDLLVLANGKNIAPQKIENVLKESPLIQEAVLFGDGHEFVYGLIVPNMERLRADLGVTDGSDDELVARPEAKAAIKAEMDKVNKGLADFEKVKKYALIAAQFSIESGELTPSLKVKRKVVRQKYADKIDELIG